MNDTESQFSSRPGSLVRNHFRRSSEPNNHHSQDVSAEVRDGREENSCKAICNKSRQKWLATATVNVRWRIRAIGTAKLRPVAASANAYQERSQFFLLAEQWKTTAPSTQNSEFNLTHLYPSRLTTKLALLQSRRTTKLAVLRHHTRQRKRPSSIISVVLVRQPSSSSSVASRVLSSQLFEVQINDSDVVEKLL
jgi:hypothetical protein